MFFLKMNIQSPLPREVHLTVVAPQVCRHAMQQHVLLTFSRAFESLSTNVANEGRFVGGVRLVGSFSLNWWKGRQVI